MSYSLYKIIHLTGVFMVMLALGGLIFRGFIDKKEKEYKKLGGLTFAIGLIIVFISGFGLIAKLRIGFQGWIIAKLIIWVIFGSLIAAVNRKPEYGKILWGIVLILGFTAAFLAIIKPF